MIDKLTTIKAAACIEAYAAFIVMVTLIFLYVYGIIHSGNIRLLLLLSNGKRLSDACSLTRQKNQYLENGHNYQRPNLPLYLPANGGLLTAIAMMAAGWDGLENGAYAPGFPKDGKWNIRFEGIINGHSWFLIPMQL